MVTLILIALLFFVLIGVVLGGIFFLSLRHQFRSPEAIEKYLNSQPQLSSLQGADSAEGPGLYCSDCRLFGVQLAAGSANCPQCGKRLLTVRRAPTEPDAIPRPKGLRIEEGPDRLTIALPH